MPTKNQKHHPSGQVVAVRLDPPTIARLDKLAERTGRNRSSYLRAAIESMLPVLEHDHWTEQMNIVEEDRIRRDFREITWELLDEDEKEMLKMHPTDFQTFYSLYLRRKDEDSGNVG